MTTTYEADDATQVATRARVIFLPFCFGNPLVFYSFYIPMCSRLFSTAAVVATLPTYTQGMYVSFRIHILVHAARIFLFYSSNPKIASFFFLLFGCSLCSAAVYVRCGVCARVQIYCRIMLMQPFKNTLIGGNITYGWSSSFLFSKKFTYIQEYK